jgi:hypothetical protein
MTGPVRRRHRAAARAASLALAVLAVGCDQTFSFDVPVTPDAGAPMPAPSCRSDADCPLAALHCDPLIGGCFECAADVDCTGSASPRCDGYLHRCVECGGLRDCPSGLACEVTTRRCLPSCVEEEDCAPSAHDCDERRGVCVECDEDEECKQVVGASHCSADGAGCVECRLDSHCSEGSVCDVLSGSCVGCRDARDCAAGRVCDPTTRRCAPASIVVR